MKKVFEYVPALNDGGAETLVINYALLLDPALFDVSIVTVYPPKNTANARRARENGIKIISLYKNQSTLSKIVRRTVSKIPQRLRHLLQKEKPDVLHVHLQCMQHLEKATRGIQGIKLLYTCHNELQYMLTGARRAEGDAARKLIETHGLQMIALHSTMKNEIDSLFNISNTCVINNGVDFSSFRNIEESKESIRKSLGIPIDAFVVGHIGRFTKQKNHEYLIEVFSEILRREQKAFLLIIGKGELQDRIIDKISRAGISSNVLNLSGRTDTPRLYKAMDVFVFPSLFEGLSVTLVEAQVAGLRCIVSNRINEATFLSENTIPLDIDLPPSKWADVVLNKSITASEYGDINRFDMKQEIKKLEQLYLQ